MPASQSSPKITDWRTSLDAAIDARFGEMVRIRRHLHAQPELSGSEYETTRFIGQQVRSLGLEPRIGHDGRGVVVDAPVAAGGAKIALRADIDALPVSEQNSLEYRSQQPGCMHACGHDAHAAILWGALAGLQAVADRDELPYPVNWRMIFQPAEETLVGASEMIEQGFLDDVSAIVACHVDPSRQVGCVGVRSGTFTANCDSLVIRVVGRGGHAARPHDTVDPIAAAAQLISAIYALVPRGVDSQDPAVVSIGMIEGGHAANVIPGEVLLKGTIRTLHQSVRTAVHEKLRQTAAGVATATGTQIDLAVETGICAVVNDAVVNDVLRAAAVELLTAEHVQDILRPSMGSEDFAAYLNRAPGAMFRLGCASPTAGCSGLHTPTFNVDEQALAIGAKILARAAVLWTDPRRGA